MEDRYIKNFTNLINREQQNNLLTKHIGVIGCGGNGGYTIEFLARLGIGELSIWDGDKFEESNLNRQIFCTHSTIGQNKAFVAAQKVQDINNTLRCNAYLNFFGDNEQDLNNALKCDFIILCADSGYNWEKYRSLIHEIILHDIPVIDEGVIDSGAFIKIITKEDIKEFDAQTEGQKKFLIDHTEVSQTAYLCAIAVAFSVSEMVKYFNREKNPAIGQCIEFDINKMQIHRYDFEYGQLY